MFHHQGEVAQEFWSPRSAPSQKRQARDGEGEAAPAPLACPPLLNGAHDDRACRVVGCARLGGAIVRAERDASPPNRSWFAHYVRSCRSPLPSGALMRSRRAQAAFARVVSAIKPECGRPARAIAPPSRAQPVPKRAPCASAAFERGGGRAHGARGQHDSPLPLSAPSCRPPRAWSVGSRSKRVLRQRLGRSRPPAARGTPAVRTSARPPARRWTAHPRFAGAKRACRSPIPAKSRNPGPGTLLVRTGAPPLFSGSSEASLCFRVVAAAAAVGAGPRS